MQLQNINKQEICLWGKASERWEDEICFQSVLRIYLDAFGHITLPKNPVCSAVRRFHSDQYSIKTNIHECINESGIDGVCVQWCFASDAQFSNECEVLFLLMYSNSADMLFPQ